MRNSHTPHPHRTNAHGTNAHRTNARGGRATRAMRLSWAAGLTAIVVASGCSTEDDTATTSGNDADTPTVAVSFYPLEFVVEELAGDTVQLTPLTKPGMEPHDLELSASDLADIEDADLVIYLSGFQPAVDAAVESLDESKVFDVAEAADLVPYEADNPERDESETDVDPHFWLDPVRVDAVAGAVADRLAALNGSVESAVDGARAALSTELTDLDGEFESGLQTCVNRTIVTSHSAFGYLASRYSLTQRGITGLSPDAEPSAGELADVAAFVRDNQVETIYFETLVDPAIAETVASETGATTAVLDPIEGLTDDSEGDNYLEVMRSNLTNLTAGQRCS